MTRRTGREPSPADLRAVSRHIYSAVSLGFAIPFTFATTLGLAAVALQGDPSMRVLSPADVSAGLPAPSAAAALLGQGGAAAMLVLLFLAVTSATSAELIAVSSILTYDVYKASEYRLRYDLRMSVDVVFSFHVPFRNT